ncbi:MAG: EAL domain-containing protein [Reinekea sp.]
MTTPKAQRPFSNALIGLIGIGFCSGLLLSLGIWLFAADLGMPGTMFGVILVFLSLTAALIGVRLYAHISLGLAQNDQKHLQNALCQAKDMIDTNKQLREDHILLQSVFQNLPFPVWMKDRFGRYLVTNQVFVKQWCNGHDPIGKTDSDMLNPKLVEIFTEADQTAMDAQKTQRLELRLDLTGQAAKWVRIERYPLIGDQDQTLGVLGFAMDISAYKKNSAETDLGMRDPVTGLMSQAGLTTFIETNASPDTLSYCACVDIDHFKVLNDSLGQSAGDQLLNIIAERLMKASETSEVIARISADEFILFWQGENRAIFNDRLARLHDLLNQPFTLGESQYSFTTSIGAACSPHHGETLQQLKQNAGIALFNAKKHGRNQIHWFQETYQDQALRRLNKEQLLRQSILEGDLDIHAQPRVNCRNGEIDALECLIRIQTPDKVLTYPSSFIELAEQNGLISELDRYVLDSALSQIHDWLQSDVQPLALAVNLSLQSINCILLDHINHWQQINPDVFQYLEIELTEHHLPEQSDSLITHLEELREFGIRLALDDFGTGYANLSRLPDWPFQILKLDRSFIVDLPTSPKQQAVVKSIIDLCLTLGIEVVAEGVETEQELTLVDQLGCHRIQGFVYARPKPMADIDNWLNERKITAQ